MTTETKIVAIVIAVLVVAVAALFLVPSLSELGEPEATAAWVGIEVEGSGTAVVGPVEIEAGTPFTLHAILEARDGDEPVYYTEAPGVTIGGEAVPVERVRRWDRRKPVQVLWSTVEGGRRVTELAPGNAAEQIGFVEFLRTDWPYAWSVRGRLEPDADDALATPASRLERPFGTLRYQVAIEIYAEESAIPQQRISSWGGSQLPQRAADFPTVVAALPGPAGPASSVFGLTQLVAPPEAPAELQRQLVDLTREHLAYATLPVIRRVIFAAGADPENLPWRYVDFDGTLAWGDDVHPGDLLRAGERTVVLYADAAPGQTEAAEPAPGNGVLDRDDLCFDFVQGAGVRSLGEVFEEEGGQVEWVQMTTTGAS
jgi:hypothetical protein